MPSELLREAHVSVKDCKSVFVSQLVTNREAHWSQREPEPLGPARERERRQSQAGPLQSSKRVQREVGRQLIGVGLTAASPIISGCSCVLSDLYRLGGRLVIAKKIADNSAGIKTRRSSKVGGRCRFRAEWGSAFADDKRC